jgi:hypothetical protein
MLPVQEYKLRIDSIIEQLPDEKVEELLDYATFLNHRYSKQTKQPGQSKSGINEESLMLQQESLKKIWDHPEEDIYDL